MINFSERNPLYQVCISILAHKQRFPDKYCILHFEASFCNYLSRTCWSCGPTCITMMENSFVVKPLISVTQQLIGLYNFGCSVIASLWPSGCLNTWQDRKTFFMDTFPYYKSDTMEYNPNWPNCAMFHNTDIRGMCTKYLNQES